MKVNQAMGWRTMCLVRGMIMVGWLSNTQIYLCIYLYLFFEGHHCCRQNSLGKRNNHLSSVLSWITKHCNNTSTQQYPCRKCKSAISRSEKISAHQDNIELSQRPLVLSQYSCNSVIASPFCDPLLHSGQVRCLLSPQGLNKVCIKSKAKAKP